MVRWMEKEGYDVSYTTDVDTHANPNQLTPGMHKVFLSVGHDEYWSWEMRNNLQQARDRSDRPLSIGFFGANISHWQIRFEPSGTKPNRTIVAYKQFTSLDTTTNPVIFRDPVQTNADPTDNYLTTGYWRDNELFGTQCPPSRPNCYMKPEDELVGVMTDVTNPVGNGNFQFDAVCPAWVKTGMAAPQTNFNGLLGYEADRIFNISNYANRTWSKVAESQFVGPNITTLSHAVYYRMTTSGARVFAAGTIQWAWGLDEFGANAMHGPVWHANHYNPDVEVVTKNILTCLRDGGAACGS